MPRPPSYATKRELKEVEKKVDQLEKNVWKELKPYKKNPSKKNK